MLLCVLVHRTPPLTHEPRLCRNGPHTASSMSNLMLVGLERRVDMGRATGIVRAYYATHDGGGDYDDDDGVDDDGVCCRRV
jgi:hypothetical protein